MIQGEKIVVLTLKPFDHQAGQCAVQIYGGHLFESVAAIEPTFAFDQIAVQFIQFVRIVENQCRNDRTIHTANNGIIHLNEMQNAVVVCGVDVVQVLTPLRGFLMDGDWTVVDFTVYFDTGIEYIYSC